MALAQTFKNEASGKSLSRIAGGGRRRRFALQHHRSQLIGTADDRRGQACPPCRREKHSIQIVQTWSALIQFR
jgi:hypothetical protein